MVPSNTSVCEMSDDIARQASSAPASGGTGNFSAVSSADLVETCCVSRGNQNIDAVSHEFVQSMTHTQDGTRFAWGGLNMLTSHTRAEGQCILLC